MQPASKLSAILKVLLWIAGAVVGVVIIRYGGELLFYLPGAIAKRISLELTGSSKGVVTSFFFYLVAAGFVLAVATAGWLIVLVHKRLVRRQGNPRSLRE
ncbi:MAG: hypothetical protein HYX94_14330 [Chloroflexi bacterium]|nr:hypothetical protein [Chloroflexota bacterium]